MRNKMKQDLGKMFATFLLVTGIYTTAAFNIFTTPELKFTNNNSLFGQVVVGSNNRVLVPVKGHVFKCMLDGSCSPVKGTEIVKKGLRPIISVSSTLSKKDEQLLVCHQVRTRTGSAEDFNGLCVNALNDQKMEEISPSQLVSQQMKQDALEDDKKNEQAKSRKRRQAEPNDEDEEDEDEDAGTEIAFVLDGSGSIGPEDFSLAKTFITTVMSNVWSKCFTCKFAVVQFGSEIRTELSLLENDDQALNKVKNIQQIYNLTKTASALYHVLTEVFVPEYGSIVNSKKIIIVLSDGEMRGRQNRTLEEVLNMAEMNGVLRYSIGVGPEVNSSQKAIGEMIQIAGSQERFFLVSNYAALNEILSNIEKSIFDIEGIKKGAGFIFELAEAGFSSHLTHEGSMLFGAVGAYDWSGGIILKGNEEKVTFLNATTDEQRFSYLGYSVASARTDTKTLYISGAPRYDLTGAVFIFDGTNQEMIPGDQVGSYFGSVLCALDIDNNQKTDYLFVGAPHFHVKGEEGKVLVYKLHQGQFKREDYVLHGMREHVYARFGSAIVDIGDIDGNRYRDIAVGAPLEAGDGLPEGSIYIYNGFQNGIDQHYSQRIAPSDLGMKLVYFGQAVTAVSDSRKGQKGLLISVGSESAVTVLKTLPVVIIKPSIQLEYGLDKISLRIQNKNESSHTFTNMNICFDDVRRKTDYGESLLIEYQVDLDFGKEEKRFLFADQHEKQIRFNVTKERNCIDPKPVEYVGCYDCFSPIQIKVQFILVPPADGIPVRVLDAFSPTEFIKEIEFEKECKVPHNCQPNISLADSKLSRELVIIGSSQTLSITFDLKNSGESSYMTTLTLTYPKMLQPRKTEGGHCELKNDNLQIMCKLLHPVFKGAAETSVTIEWQPINTRKSDLINASISAVLTGGNDGTEKLDSKEYNFEVRNALKVMLTGTPSPNRLSITEGEENKDPKQLQFTFMLLGENKYKASITVIITIPKKTHGTEVIFKTVQPQENCNLQSGENAESNHRIKCNLTELQEIIIKTDVIIHDIKDTAEKITATAELRFNESIYEGQNVKEMETVEVLLIKLKVVKSTAPIIGGSIGGFLLLIIIIIVLIKCGFFRRRRHLERTQSTH